MPAGREKGPFLRWVFLTGAALVIALAGSRQPGLHFLAAALLPVPFALLVILLDIYFAAACLLLVGPLLFLWTNTAGTFFMLLEKGCLGILYGILFKNRVRADRALAAGVAAAVLLSFAAALLIFVSGGGSVLALDEETRLEFFRLIDAWRETGAIENLPLNWQQDFANRVVYYYELLLPGQYTLSAAVLGALSFFALALVSSVFKFNLPPGPGFSRISYPWYSIWGLIAGLGFILAGDQFSLRILVITGLNILFVLFYAFLLLGTSVALFFWKAIKMPFIFRFLIVLLAFFYLPIAATVLLLLGITDPLINYRRLPGGGS